MYDPRRTVSAPPLDDELAALVEHVAAQVHDAWAALRLDEGWRYGPVRDDARKLTPDLRPYAELSEDRREYDRRTARTVLESVIALGYRIDKR